MINEFLGLNEKISRYSFNSSLTLRSHSNASVFFNHSILTLMSGDNMKSFLMKRLGSSMVGLLMLLLFPLHASAETLMVYTAVEAEDLKRCLLYTSPSPRDATLSRMPSSA